MHAWCGTVGTKRMNIYTNTHTHAHKHIRTGSGWPQSRRNSRLPNQPRHGARQVCGDSKLGDPEHGARCAKGSCVRFPALQLRLLSAVCWGWLFHAAQSGCVCVHRMCMRVGVVRECECVSVIGGFLCGEAVRRHESSCVRESWWKVG